MSIKQLKTKLDNLKIWKESENVVVVPLVSMSCYICAVSCRNFLIHESFFRFVEAWKNCSAFSLYAVDCRQALFSRTLNIPFTYLPIYYWKLRKILSTLAFVFFYPLVLKMIVHEVSQPKSEWTQKAHIWMPNSMSNEMINMEVIHMSICMVRVLILKNNSTAVLQKDFRID